MDKLLCTLFLILMALLVGAQSSLEGPCFNFTGSSYLVFTPNNFDNNNAIHYSLKFRTRQENGIIMYARGFYGDDEALFIRGGKLYYHLFNMSPTGVENSYGGHYEGNVRVNIWNWVTVHVYRNWVKRDPRLGHESYQTGFVVQINGQTHSHLDNRQRSNISIHNTIYFGGYREVLSTTVGNFEGQIKDIREEKNGLVFETPSLNYMSRVGLWCEDILPV